MITLIKFLKRIFKFLNKDYPIITNTISIIALIIAVSTMNKATEQFNLSNEQSDALFKKQFSQTDSLFSTQIQQSDSLFTQLFSKNDSLLNHISNLQGISDRQLRTLNTTLIENKESGRPIFNFIGTQIGNQIITHDENEDCTIEIFVNFTNEGNRIAYECVYRSFVIFDDFKDFQSGFSDPSFVVHPHENIPSLISIQIPKKFKDNFFICFELNYYDLKLDKYFMQTYYAQYQKVISLNFYTARDYEPKLVEVINKILIKANKPLWGEYYKTK